MPTQQPDLLLGSSRYMPAQRALARSLSTIRFARDLWRSPKAAVAKQHSSLHSRTIPASEAASADLRSPAMVITLRPSRSAGPVLVRVKSFAAGEKIVVVRPKTRQGHGRRTLLRSCSDRTALFLQWKLPQPTELAKLRAHPLGKSAGLQFHQLFCML